MRTKIGLFVLGAVLATLVVLVAPRLLGRMGTYAGVAAIEDASGAVSIVSDSNPLSYDSCVDTNRTAQAFLSVHPDVRRFGLECVRINFTSTGAAK